jgi:hypothetical protein
VVPTNAEKHCIPRAGFDNLAKRFTGDRADPDLGVIAPTLAASAG